MTIRQNFWFITGSAFTPYSNVFSGTTGGSWSNNTVTIPTGATQVVIKAWGPGGSGALSTGGGGGGGGGGYAVKTVTLVSGDAGKTISCSVGNARLGRSTSQGAGLAGNSSLVPGLTSSTFTLSQITAASGGGGGVFVGGTGGTASGGDTNTTGSAGSAGTGCACSPQGGDGGASGDGSTAGGAGGFSGVPDLVGGGGGGGGDAGGVGNPGNGGAGGPGKVSFDWT